MREIKKTRIGVDKINHIRARLPMYKSIHNTVRHLYDKKTETINILMFDERTNRCVGIVDVSLGAGTTSSVAHDSDAIEKL